LAKELSVNVVWKDPNPPAPVVETDEYGACSSKSVINSLMLQDETPSRSSTTERDDLAIAQLMQAEFDKEFDEELKKIEHKRNKSNIAKFDLTRDWL
jgi:hypothetical protein